MKKEKAPQMEINYEDFCEILGYRFTRVILFKKALTHSSFTKNKLDSNERLEFLGDRVLGLSIAKMLYTTYPLDEEGSLAIRHAALVSTKTLASIAEAMCIPCIIDISEEERKRKGLKNRNILADCVEAILGAIYMDSDFETVFKVIERFWKRRIEESKKPIKDCKTTLQEYTQKKFGFPPEYILISRSGPAHEPTFTVSSTVDGITATASGSSKKEAEQLVAAELVQRFDLIKDDN